MWATLYEFLARSYPFVRGKGRFILRLTRILPLESYTRALPVGPYTILLDPVDDNDAIYFFGLAGKAFRTLLPVLLRSGDVVVDVGANVGYFSVLARSIVGDCGEVIAIEPNPRLFERLKNHLASQKSGIRLHQAAVWNKEKKSADFHVATTSGWSSLVQNPTFTLQQTVTVPAWTLDAFLDDQEVGAIRLMKLDIEGGEIDALMGAKKTLQSGRIDFLLIEAEANRMSAFGRTGQDLSALLVKTGYQMVCSVKNDVIVPPVSESEIGKFNGDLLYMRKELKSPKLFD